jgi:iron complex outermembrane receptor protein
LTLEEAYGWRNRTIPTAPFNTIFNDPGTHTIDAPGFLDLKYEHKFGGDWGYRARFYYDHYNFSGSYPYDASSKGGPSRVVNEDLAIGQRWGAEFEVSKKPGDHQTPIAGLEYRDDFQQVQRNYDLQPYFRYLNDHRSSSIGAAFVQDSIPRRSNLTDFRVT